MPNGTYGGVKGWGLAALAYSITKMFHSPAINLESNLV